MRPSFYCTINTSFSFVCFVYCLYQLNFERKSSGATSSDMKYQVQKGRGIEKVGWTLQMRTLK